MAIGHLSPQQSLPPLKYKQLNTTTWGTGGNTCTITDPYISPNSQVDAWVTGTIPPAGTWAFNVSNGSCTITSSDSESPSLTIAYLIF